MAYYVGEGMAAGNKNIGDMINNRIAQTQSQFLPDQLRIANALKQNELNFAPQMSQATLAEKQQMAPYYHALTGEAGARSGLYGQQIKELAQKINNPNLGSEGALGTIAYGNWLSKNQPRQPQDVQQQQILQQLQQQQQMRQMQQMQAQQQAQQNSNAPQQQQPDILSSTIKSLMSGQQMPAQQQIPMRAPQVAPSQAMNAPGMQQQPAALQQIQQQMQQAQQAQQMPQQGITPEMAQQLIKNGMQRSQMMAQQTPGGAYGLGVGAKEQNFFQNLVHQDNPHLQTPEQIYEAANVLASGGSTLSDGTKLNPLSPAAQASLDRITKSGTTAGLVTQNVKANQAESELQAMEPMITKDFAPYATTYAGYSPQQIADTFKRDKNSQVTLGNFVASQAGQYELAQIRNRIAAGEPGITATQELMNKSGQVIGTMFPNLSAEARAQASKRLNEYLQEGLKARNAQGINASQLRKENYTSGNQGQGAPAQQQQQSGDGPKANAPEGTTKQIGGKTYRVINGKWHE